MLSICVACSSNEDVQETRSDTIEGNALVVYFSRTGNTEAVAQEIASQTDAQVFEIVPEEAYPEDYDAMLEVAQQEQDQQAHPNLAQDIEGIEDYDMIYLGYPIWYSDMPMIMYTVLDQYDFSGKTIAPFCTSGGSGLSQTVETIQEMEPDTHVTEGLSISGSEAQDCADAVSQWLSQIG